MNIEKNWFVDSAPQGFDRCTKTNTTESKKRQR